MIGLLLLWTKSTVMLLDPDTIGVISFPSDRIAFSNGSKAPSDMHVFCGWWNRADTPLCNQLNNEPDSAVLCGGSCDFIDANYGGERNMTCYSNSIHLKWKSTLVVCEERLVNETETRRWVEQDSCYLVLEEVYAEGTIQWNPIAKQNINLNIHRYNEVIKRYGKHLNEHQIVTMGPTIFASYCRFNTTQVAYDLAETIRGGLNVGVSVYRNLRRIANERPATADLWNELVQKNAISVCSKSTVESEYVISPTYAYCTLVAWNLWMWFIGLLIDILMIAVAILVVLLCLLVLPKCVHKAIYIALFFWGIPLVLKCLRFDNPNDFFYFPSKQ